MTHSEHKAPKKNRIAGFTKKLFLGGFHSPKDKRNLFQEEIQNLTDLWNAVDNDFGIERSVKLFLTLSKFLFPGLYVRVILYRLLGSISYRIGIEFYVLLKLFLPIIFYVAGGVNASWLHYLIIYSMIETFLFLLSKVYVGHLNIIDRVFYLRHITLLIVNFIEITLSFGYLYYYYNNHIPHFFNLTHITFLDAVYFSFTTAGTVGFGDIYITHPIGKLLAIFQIFFFFLFATLLLNRLSVNNKK